MLAARPLAAVHREAELHRAVPQREQAPRWAAQLTVVRRRAELLRVT